ncbi:MAG: hypothetical protein B9S32_14480 [Verrucomicrobia bacterium Tous-C9LFEB]|nr:MAG: hypothetical protein B9S32_14480 [Verrucomicrobia bacterium Tous-C9LFEB]
MDGSAWPILAFLFLFSWSVDVRAEEKKQGVDRFAAALDSLNNLGLPDTSKGEYVTLTVFHLPSEFNSGLGLTGNAWRLPSDKKGGEQIFVTVNGNVIFVRIDGPEASASTEEEGMPKVWSGRATPADFKQDCAAVLKLAEQQDESFPYQLPDPLLFAAFARQAGFPVEAEKICGALLKRSEKPREAIQRSISRLANARYDTALTEFSRKPDWLKLANAIASIRADCGANWVYHDAAGLLEAKVRIQAVRKENGLASVKNISAEDRKFLSELQQNAGLIRGGEYDLWLIPATAGSSRVNTLNPFALTLRKRGLSAFPLLIRLEKEQALLPTIYAPEGSPFMTSMRLGMRQMVNSRENKKPEEELLLMPRPLGLSEIPRLALRPLLVQEERYSEGNVGALLSDWHKEHPFKTAEEVSWYFIKNGDYAQFQEAATYLIAQGQNSKIEDYLLSSLADREKWSMVMAYVTNQGEKAAPFASKIKELIKQKKIVVPEEYVGTISQLMGRMEALVKPLEENMAAVAAGTVSPFKIDASAHQELPKKSFQEGLDLILKTAAAEKRPSYRRKILSWTLLLPFKHERDIGFTPPERVSPLPWATQWSELLADNRSTSVQETVGDYTAFVLELVSAGMDFTSIRSLHTSQESMAYLGMDAAWFQLLAERGRQRLAGKEPEPLQQVLRLPEEQKKKLMAEVEKQSPGQMEGWVRKLEYVQKQALAPELTDKAALIEKINAATGRIGDVQVSGKLADELAWMKLKGSVLDRSLLEKVIQLSIAQLKKTDAMLVVISRSSLFDSWNMRVVQQNRKNLMATFMPDMDPDAENSHTYGDWMQNALGVGILGHASQAYMEMTVDGSFPEGSSKEAMEKEFYDTLQEIRKSPGDGRLPIRLFVIGTKSTAQREVIQ